MIIEIKTSPLKYNCKMVHFTVVGNLDNTDVVTDDRDLSKKFLVSILIIIST